MILTNPDEQVWNLLTGGAGSSVGCKELDKLKRLLQERNIFFVVDHDTRYHWIRLRSRRDLQMIQVKADVVATGEAALLEIRYAGQVVTGLHATEALEQLLQYYFADDTAALKNHGEGI